MPIPSVQDIIKLVKAGATIEAQEKIMELRQAMIDLQDENIRLRGEIQELRGQLSTVSQPMFPSCPKCGQPTYAVKESKPDPHFGPLGGINRTHVCKSCGFTETILVTPK
jgi:hypothetical protein